MTGGVNRLPPVGLIDFSTGDGGGGAGVAGGGGAVAVTVFVTVTFSGAGASFAQAESTPMARIAPMPAVATRRRAIRPDLMMRPICIVNLNYIVQKFPRQRVDRRDAACIVGGWACRAIDDTVQLFGAVNSRAGLAGSTIVLPSVFPARDTSMASRCSPSSSTKVSWRWCGRQLSGCRRRRPGGTGGAGATRVRFAQRYRQAPAVDQAQQR
jgi:hypothetical protein